MVVPITALYAGLLALIGVVLGAGSGSLRARTGVSLGDGGDAQQFVARFETDYGAKFPKAVASLRRDEVLLLTFFDFPADHWLHLRTAKIASTLGVVPLGPGYFRCGCGLKVSGGRR